MLPSVYFHPRSFWSGRFNGVTRYVCELAQHLQQLGVRVHIPIKETPNEHLRQAPFYPTAAAEAMPAPAFWRLLRRMGNCTPWAELFRRQELRQEGLAFLRKGRFDILHPSHTNATELLPHLGRKPLVITVHDMIHELYPAAFPPSDCSAARKKMYAERADRIIAISECTKNDLVRLLGISPGRIDVVHHGNSLTLPPGHEDIRMPLPERYILFVGQRQAYKNFTRFARAAARLMQQDDSLHLACIGGGAFRPAELELLESLRIRPRTQQLSVTDAELAVAYKRSLAFVYPSEYEGFGLPILEAFACGAPVICARASCFPEVAGNAALYFDPLSVDDMAARMEQVCFHEDRRAALLAAGQRRLADFSWQRCAQETLRSYQAALNSAT